MSLHVFASQMLLAEQNSQDHSSSQQAAFQLIEDFANRRQKFGEEKYAQFAATLEDSHDREERMMAAFGLSAYHLGKEQFQESLHYLTSAEILSQPSDPVAPLIALHKTLINFESGAFKRAITLGKRIESKDPLLGTTLALYRARIVIEAYSRLRLYSKAIEYGRITTKKFPNSAPRNTDIQVALARAYMRGGIINRDFFKHLENSASFYPFTEDARWAFETLKKYSCQDHLKHSQAAPNVYHVSQPLLGELARNSTSDPALREWVMTALQGYTEGAVGSVVKMTDQERISFMITSRLYVEAFDLTQKILAANLSIPKSMDRPKFLLQLARVSAETQQDDMALKYYEQHAKEFFGGNFPPKIAELVGFAMQRLKKFSEASEVFSYAAMRGAPDYVRWQHFWSLYRAQKWDEALAVLNRKSYVAPQDPTEPNAILYWKAKLLENLNQKNAARAEYIALVEKDPMSFYAPLVRDRFPSIPEMEIDIDEASPLTASLLGNVPRSDIIRSKLVSKEDPYPIPYEDQINLASEKMGLNRYFLLSIMRAESRFNASAVSPVGARGLLQIMPYTSAKIASDINHHKFSLEDLETPEVNITYGAYYLKVLLNLFQDNPLVASAAYNAGPIAVNRWLERCNECSIDEFVESIPYRETRRYVKEVFRNFTAYTKKHGPIEKIPLKWDIPAPLSDISKLY